MKSVNTDVAYEYILKKIVTGATNCIWEFRTRNRPKLTRPF